MGGVAVVALAGCQNMEEQLGAKLAEGIVNSTTGGEVKVDFGDLKNGEMKITAKDGGSLELSGDGQNGSMKVVDASGKTVLDANGNEGSLTVKGEDGKVGYKASSGGGRPADVPADLPTLPEGHDFSYVNASVGGMDVVTYNVAGKDLKAACDRQAGLLMGVGWTVNASGFTMELEDSLILSYAKGDVTVALSCNTYKDGQVSVTMQKTKKAH